MSMSYARRRREGYPPIGEQLDAILKTFNSFRMNGVELPQEMNDLLGKWLSVKSSNPKPIREGGG